MFKPWGTICLASLMCITTACGGGSSNNGQETNKPEVIENPFELTFSENSIDISGDESQKSLLIDATTSGELQSEAVFVFTEISGDAIESAEAIVNANTGHLAVTTKDELWSGQHHGEIRIEVCGDELCENHLADSPYTIPYTINIETSRYRIKPEPHYAVKHFAQPTENYTLTMFTETNSEISPIKMWVDIPDHIVEYVLPPSLIRDLNVSDINNEYFLFFPKNHIEGESNKEYKIRTKNTEGKYDYIYLEVNSTISPEGVHPDHFRVFENTVRFRVPQNRFIENDVSAIYYVPMYRPYNTNDEQDLIFTIDYASNDESNDVMDEMDNTDEIIDETAHEWIRASNDSAPTNPENDSTHNREPDTFKISVSALNMDVGVYKGQITASDFDGQSQTVNIEMQVYSGIVDIFEQFNFQQQDSDLDYKSLSFVTSFEREPDSLSWSIEALDEWIEIHPDDQGIIHTDRRFQVNVDIDYIANLPNNTLRKGYLKINHHPQDDTHPIAPGLVTIEISKKLPEITQLSTSFIHVNEAFEVEITGENLTDESRFAFYPTGNENGIQALVEPNYTIEFLGGKTYKVTFEAIETVGDYQLMAISDLDIQYDLEKEFVTSPQVKVTE